MILVAYLVFVTVILGAGTLTASIIPTRGARIGLGAALFLALVVDLTWFTAPLLDWSATLGDAAWIGAFALVIAGALLTARHYAHSRHELIVWIWPTTRDLAFLAVVFTALGAVVLVLPVPLDTDAQGFGYLALTLRDGEDYTTLAPWHPEIETLYSPGYTGLIAHLSARFDLGIQTLMLIVSAATAGLFVWLSYDLGCELEGPRTGRGLMLASLIGTGMVTAFMDSHYTALLALLFAMAFLTFALRFLTTGRWSSALFATICLAAVPFTQPDTTLALIMGYAPWLVVVWLSRPRPSLRVWLVLTAVIPLVALGITIPWLDSLRDLLGSGIESPFQVESTHWRTLVLMHGGVIVGLAALGGLIGLGQRRAIPLLMIVWLAGIVEFSTLGLLEKNFPDLMEPLLKYDYPFSLAWHGPVIPYTVLGGLALVWLANRLGGEQVDRVIAGVVPLVLLVMAVGIAAVVVFFDPLLDASKDIKQLKFFGAFSSWADVRAMEWLRENTPPGARVLNHPGPHEGDWTPVISERDTVYFRPQPFFRRTAQADAEQASFRPFWTDPAGEDFQARLLEAGIQYVLVPQVFGDPASYDTLIRWRQPLDEAAAYLQTPMSVVPFLRLVYEQDGAQVYEVLPPG